ncbi:hypothetical protein, partial [Candidatus Phycosocius spiralis]|uniref:Uncharacterized protein n=1 Tax=Candidatus Phycosocius spiralis TaxID=2815099 RepID=A0ABQ4PWB4_9PROT
MALIIDVTAAGVVVGHHMIGDLDDLMICENAGDFARSFDILFSKTLMQVTSKLTSVRLLRVQVR